MKTVFEKESTIERWDDDYYHPISLWLYDQAISDMLKVMGAAPGDTILDAGCGPGGHSVRAARAGLRVCAMDISGAMLSRARRLAEKENVVDAISFYRKDLTRTDFPDASFRYAFSWGVIIHIPAAEKALDELARIMEPGGKLALYLVNKSAPDHKIKNVARLVMRKPSAGVERLPLGDRNWYEKNGDKFCAWAFDANALVDYLKQKGFLLVKRRIVELSQIQRHMNKPYLSGFVRKSLLHLNNLAYKINPPPVLGVGNLFVFEKGGRLSDPC